MHTSAQTPSVCRTLTRGLATGLLLTQSALLSFAQTAPPATTSTTPETSGATVVLETFTVTAGFSGSLAAAAEVKQKQTLIAEVVAAEDLGKLPDISIAESLTRLPGLTTQRLNGRAQAIVIRGLNGDFSTGLLNGREQVSTGAGRAVEYDQYPAELLSGVVVYKATDASLVGQGLAGTVDMHTVRPLTFGRRAIAANVFYEWTDLDTKNPGADTDGKRATVSYIDQLADGKVGVALGYSHSDRPGTGEQWNAWGFPTVDKGTSPGEPFVLGGAKPFLRSSNLKRDSYMGVLEFKPNEKLHTTLDLFFSDFREVQLLKGIEIPLWWSSAQLRPGFTVEDGLITKGTFGNVFGVARNDIVTRDAKVYNIGWNTQFGDKEGWFFDLDGAYSRITRKDLVLETYSGFGSNQVGTPDSITYTLGNGKGGAIFSSLLDYTDATKVRLTSPQGWASDIVPGGQVGFLKGPRSRDELGQFKFKAQRKLNGIFSRAEAGIAYTRRSKFEIEAGPQGKEGFFLALKNGATSAPLPPTNGVADLSFIGIPGLYSYDPLKLLNSGFYDLRPNDNPAFVANNWSVVEKVYQAHVKFDIDTKIGSVPVTGNIGTQYIHSNQQATGLSASGPTIVPVSGGAKYNDWVPSLNLNLHLQERTTLRLSAARQLARQRMNDMRAGSTFSFNPNLANSTDPTQSAWSANGGNPELQPWRSNSFDLSLEHYFADNMGYWAIAGFYKDLRSFNFNGNSIADFTGLPTGVVGVTPATNLGLRNQPQNGNGGDVRGLEFTLSLPGEKFAPFLKGFGIIASASFFDSSIKPVAGQPAIQLPGLSKRVQSGTVYYEKHGFAARLSARYRSDYRGDISTFGPRGENFRNLQSETILDAQISYTFNRGFLKNVTLIAQGNNLTDEALFATQGATDGRLVQDYQRYGTNYSIGASYKF